MEETQEVYGSFNPIIGMVLERLLELDLDQQDFDTELDEYNYLVGLLKRIEKSAGLPITTVFKRKRGGGKLEPPKKKLKTEKEETNEAPE